MKNPASWFEIYVYDLHRAQQLWGEWRLGAHAGIQARGQYDWLALYRFWTLN